MTFLFKFLVPALLFLTACSSTAIKSGSGDLLNEEQNSNFVLSNPDFAMRVDTLGVISFQGVDVEIDTTGGCDNADTTNLSRECNELTSSLIEFEYNRIVREQSDSAYGNPFIKELVPGVSTVPVHDNYLDSLVEKLKQSMPVDGYSVRVPGVYAGNEKMNNQTMTIVSQICTAYSVQYLLVPLFLKVDFYEANSIQVESLIVLFNNESSEIPQIVYFKITQKTNAGSLLHQIMQVINVQIAASFRSMDVSVD